MSAQLDDFTTCLDLRPAGSGELRAAQTHLRRPNFAPRATQDHLRTAQEPPKSRQEGLRSPGAPESLQKPLKNNGFYEVS